MIMNIEKTGLRYIVRNDLIDIYFSVYDVMTFMTHALKTFYSFIYIYIILIHPYIPGGVCHKRHNAIKSTGKLN